MTPEAAGTEHLARRADAPPRAHHECAGNGSRRWRMDLAVGRAVGQRLAGFVGMSGSAGSERTRREDGGACRGPLW